MLLSDGLRSIARRGRASGELVRLAAAGGPARDLARAIKEAWTEHLSSEERAYVERIEALRRRLCASTEDLELRDFGAPPLDSEAPQPPGWVIHRSLGDMTVASSKPYCWALLLFKLIRIFQPKTAIELGTCVGIS